MDTEQYLLDYYAKNGRKIRQTVDKILRQFTWITDMDHFYSLANEVFVTDVLPNYDESKGDFDGWVYSCLNKKLLTGITAMNRQKRTPYLRDKNGNIIFGKDKKPIMMNVVSIDTPISTDEGNFTIGDTISSDFDIEKELFGEDDISETKIEKYLNRLSKLQRKIVEMLAGGYKPAEIREVLHIKDSEYADCIQAIQSYKNISILL